MPAYLTAEMAREAVGLYVVEHQKTGPASSAGWACPAKLKRVISDSQCVVQPNGHLREEVTEISALRLWMKGNHQLGEQAMKRAQAIDAVASLQAKISASSIRSISMDEAKDLLGNGVNPLCLARATMKTRRAALGRLVGVRENGLLVKITGEDYPPQRYDEGLVGMPIGIDMDQLDYNLLEKALSGVMGQAIPDKSDMPVAAVREEVPQPQQPKPPALNGKLAVPAAIPFPIRAPAGAEVPRQPKPEGKGDWVIVDRKRRAFWSRGENNPAGEWVKDIAKVRVYDASKGVNAAATFLGKTPLGDNCEPMSLEQAKFFADIWYRPSRLAEVTAEAEAAVAAVQEETAHKTPEPESPWPRAPDGPVTTGHRARFNLALAIRERAAAEVMLLEAKSKEALARADWEIEQLGEA